MFGPPSSSSGMNNLGLEDLALLEGYVLALGRGDTAAASSLRGRAVPGSAAFFELELRGVFTALHAAMEERPFEQHGSADAPVEQPDLDDLFRKAKKLIRGYRNCPVEYKARLNLLLASSGAGRAGWFGACGADSVLGPEISGLVQSALAQSTLQTSSGGGGGGPQPVPQHDGATSTSANAVAELSATSDLSDWQFPKSHHEALLEQFYLSNGKVSLPFCLLGRVHWGRFLLACATSFEQSNSTMFGHATEQPRPHHFFLKKQYHKGDALLGFCRSLAQESPAQLGLLFREGVLGEGTLFSAIVAAFKGVEEVPDDVVVNVNDFSALDWQLGWADHIWPSLTTAQVEQVLKSCPRVAQTAEAFLLWVGKCELGATVSSSGERSSEAERRHTLEELEKLDEKLETYLARHLPGSQETALFSAVQARLRCEILFAKELLGEADPELVLTYLEAVFSSPQHQSSGGGRSTNTSLTGDTSTSPRPRGNPSALWQSTGRFLANHDLAPQNRKSLTTPQLHNVFTDEALLFHLRPLLLANDQAVRVRTEHRLLNIDPAHPPAKMEQRVARLSVHLRLLAGEKVTSEDTLKHFSQHELGELTKKKKLRFVDQNPEVYSCGDEVKISVSLKNVPVIKVRMYEVGGEFPAVFVRCFKHR